MRYRYTILYVDQANGEAITVDIVTNHGRTWIRLSALNPKSLDASFRADPHPLRLAKRFLAMASAHCVGFRPPQVSTFTAVEAI